MNIKDPLMRLRRQTYIHNISKKNRNGNNDFLLFKYSALKKSLILYGEKISYD